ncbi:MAG: amidophosphoribosyltransferase [Candidatus Sungbacteria bacterium RIFCSPLOWO2_12_FULL_41_11]|uniref:Amidophosphoribosyltransferase n=1 Tax=Candidatus Sungbacteria bacterium RIFCSPLOWO2_12_FULL_41_11 TaxID=1802286 RepID=A0A1G2LMR7_9BACT|nr:MAG: Amidophosphoribosyltransferase [Parcubacteria group bacterium GW2011_GWA2_42_14]OGZ97526.1 MAG: amidophosphoribosyltransferase [Candidatus Sungbacteria bacterium RIFCSPHIGHO2_02_FULL_41_12b]OHA12915.1 MAG: amidophosphoribosyltransferase [Candidatus Sungbacteria bacterium RIFCSPLOWO2_12_FULL_41_11]
MCGILGIVSESGEVSQDIYAGLWSLQHRGKEGAGIATYDGNVYHEKRGMGTVEVVFGGEVLSGLLGKIGIGHVRYSTAGGSTLENVQPIQGLFKSVPFWIAHNGNLTNTKKLRQECVKQGYFFRTTTDTEIIASLIYFNESFGFEEALYRALSRVEGTYALVVLYKDVIYGMRDLTGNRPLVYGEGRGIKVLASESATCDVLGMKYLFDVRPGEIIVMKQGSLSGAYGDQMFCSTAEAFQKQKFCVFEYVYFLRPDSIFDGRRAQRVREEMGRNLWRESAVDADIVVPVPDSGNFAACGLAKEAGLPIEMALFRSHYVGRTFIEPLQERREKGMRIKLNVIPELVEGKRVVVVDDSIVRSTVIKRVINMLREAGAREIHTRISSPPYKYPCYYGIDTYRVENELIAKRLNGDVEAIRKEIGADSLHYLSLEGLRRSVMEVPGNKLKANNFCDACFSGNYHIPLKDGIFGKET